MPSFHPEYVISLDKENDKYLLTKIELDSSIWYSRFPEKIHKSFTIKMINPELADSLSSLYVAALSKTRYPTNPIIYNDGIRYHFAAKANFGIYTATKHSPAKGTRIAQLIELTLKLMTDFKEAEVFNEIHTLKQRL